jgi:exopolysaccharide production protein ExoF
MRWGFVAALFCLASGLCSGALAEDRLGISDRLKIKVQEWPDLGGEYAIASDGLISIPMIGDVKAAGLRLRELGQEISDRVQQLGGVEKRPYTAVEVVQYRPFFILGDVQRPGEYPFRPGLTVLQAIGVAGGYYRPDSSVLREVVTSKGDIQTMSLRLVRLLARAARLEAVANGLPDVAFPAELKAQEMDPSVAAVLEGERAAHALERETVVREKEDLAAIRALYEQQIASLQGQVAALRRERDSIQHQLNDLKSLSGRGLGLLPTQFSLERMLAQNTNEELSTDGAILGARQNILLGEQKTRELAHERTRVNGTELQKARDDIADVRARIATASELLTKALSTTPTALLDRPSGEQIRRNPILVVRKEGENTREIIADETTMVEPSDVIKVPLPSRSGVLSQQDAGPLKVP